MLRYRSEVHSENLEGNVEIWLCDNASLRDRGVSYVVIEDSKEDKIENTVQARS